MRAIVVLWKGDGEKISDQVSSLSSYSDEQLVEAYNREVKCGVVGVHAQMLYLIALRQVMRERFGTSPIYLEANILGLHGPVELVNGKVLFKRP